MSDNNIEPVERDIDRVVRNLRVLSDTEREILYLNLHADRLRRSYVIHRDPGFWKSPLGLTIAGTLLLMICDMGFVGMHAAATFGLFTFLINIVPVGIFFCCYFGAVYLALKRAPIALEKRASNLMAKTEIDVELPAGETFKMAESVLATFKGTKVSHVDELTRCIDAVVTKSLVYSRSHISVKTASINENRSRLTVTSESVHPQWDIFPANIALAKALTEELEKHSQVHALLLS